MADPLILVRLLPSLLKTRGDYEYAAALNRTWINTWEIEPALVGWRAYRVDGSRDPLTARTLSQLSAAIRADWAIAPPLTGSPGTAGGERALEEIRTHWHDVYALSITGSGQYRAARMHKPWTTVCAPTPGGLERTILDDWNSAGGSR